MGSRTKIPESPCDQRTPVCESAPSQDQGTKKILEEALRLRELGYRPLPIDPKTKHPWLKWKKYQTEVPSETLVQKWFRHRPDSGLGISTDGLIVIDDDDSSNGFSFSQRICETSNNHPMETTPRGKHHFFRQPEGESFRSSAGKLTDDVDVRADGGFLVVAPTIRADGGVYSQVNGRELCCSPGSLPVPPEWLLEQLRQIGQKSKPTLAQSQAGAQKIDVIRNVNHASEAGYLRRIGASEEVIAAYLYARNDESNDPLEDWEIDKVARSVSQYSPDRASFETMGGYWPAPALGLSTGENQISLVPEVRVESLIDLENRATLEELIPGILPDKSLSFVIAKPTGAKSVFLEALAFSVALGLPLMGSGPVPTRKGWVLLLLSEGANSWGSRSKAFRAHYKIPMTDQIAAVTLGVDFTSTGRIQTLVGAINDEIEKRDGVLPALIILDTLSASIPGLDENQQASMTPVCAVMQAWATLGVPVVVAHHLRKDGMKARGSSVLEGASERTLKIVKNGNVRKVVEEKVRDGVFKPFCFELISVNDRPVPVMASTPTMDFLVSAVEDDLQNALLKCGFNPTGGPASGLFGTGIKVSAILQAWNKHVPIAPSRSVDRKGYDKERNRRISAVIELLLGLHMSGDLKFHSGSISRSKRSESQQAVVIQVVGDDED